MHAQKKRRGNAEFPRTYTETYLPLLTGPIWLIVPFLDLETDSLYIVFSPTSASDLIGNSAGHIVIRKFPWKVK